MNEGAARRPFLCPLRSGNRRRRVRTDPAREPSCDLSISRLPGQQANAAV